MAPRKPRVAIGSSHQPKIANNLRSLVQTIHGKQISIDPTNAFSTNSARSLSGSPNLCLEAGNEDVGRALLPVHETRCIAVNNSVRFDCHQPMSFGCQLDE